MTNPHILIVEDEPDALELFDNLLRHFEINSDRAADGEQALSFLSGRRYDAAIIDLSLPGIDGLDLVQTIRRHNQMSSMPCIAVTAYHSSRVRQDAINAGFNAYFSKPVNEQKFMEEISRLTA